MTVLPDNILKRMEPKERAKLGKAGRTAAECSDIVLAKREKEVHVQISQWLNLHDIFFFHARTDCRTTNAVGTPDYAFLWHIEGRTIPMAIEVKVGGNKLSAEQEKVMWKMRDNGWSYHVCSSLLDMKQCLG